MAYTIKQIKKILNVQEFVAMSNTLSKVYLDFENKEYFIDTKKYEEFENIINQEYVAADNKYYKKEIYKASLFKIIETIRHQVNHSLKDDEDNNILFAAYIDFEILENLRIVINDIFGEVYKQVDKSKIKEIVLNKQKIKYSMDKLSNKVDELKIRMHKSENRFNQVFEKDNERALVLFDQLFNSSNLYDLFMKEPDAVKKFDLADKEIQESFKRVENYINENGNEFEKKTIEILKEFSKANEGESIKDININIQILQEKINDLKEKYNTNN